MKAVIIIILTYLTLSPNQTLPKDEVRFKTNLVAKLPYKEKICKKINFTNKIVKNKCKNVTFFENKAKIVNFCDTAHVAEKTIKKCRKYKLLPTSFQIPKENTAIKNQYISAGELSNGVESYLGYVISNISGNGEVVKWRNCQNITYFIINATTEEESIIKSTLTYVQLIFGYKLVEVASSKYIPGRLHTSNEFRGADLLIYVDSEGIDDVGLIKFKAQGLAVNTLVSDNSLGRWVIENSDVSLYSITNLAKRSFEETAKTEFASLLLHELGHTFGLGHPEQHLNTSPIMNAKFEGLQFSDGDLAGASLVKNKPNKCDL